MLWCAMASSPSCATPWKTENEDFYLDSIILDEVFHFDSIPWKEPARFKTPCLFQAKEVELAREFNGEPMRMES